MKDSGVKQIVLRQIIAAMDDNASKSLAMKLKKKEEPKEKKQKPVKISGLDDIRRMLG